MIALALCGLLGAAAARADELQDANALLKAGQHQQALERVNKALAAKPLDPQARFLKGVIFTEQGNTKDFKTPRGEPRAAWEKARRARIEGAKAISVGVSSAKVTLTGAASASTG
ncbi:MAG TPA: tetratricopeptide repeat protein [Burkholderiales bacterium]|nr:tetratricopeptide repeat protein [Burkholderiales bacterium]